jgi:hypothetical protein
MNKIIELSQAEVDQLLEMLKGHKADGRSGLYKLRVCTDGDWVKFKVNESMWTHGMGQLDPMCRTAAHRRVQIELAKERAGEA